MRTLLLIGLLSTQVAADAAHPKGTASQGRRYETDRADGRFKTSLSFSHHYIRSVEPKLAFPMAMRPDEFSQWQQEVRSRLLELMAFPDVPPQPEPKLVSLKPREGYRLEKWELFPEPGSVVSVLVLVPDHATTERPVPAVLCFPGSSGTKEYLAGEDEPHPDLKVPAHAEKNRMALEYVRAGMVAVAVDHPCNGELIERDGQRLIRGSARDKLSRDLIYAGRSYLGLSSFQKMQVLRWVKTLYVVDMKRIAVSGHSLGTEPAMVLAVLDPDVAAVVLNDFVHGKREQDLALARSMNGKSVFFTGGMWHCVPGMWKWLDLPDLVAAMAPRPVLATEGGVKASLDAVRRAYEVAGAKDAFTVFHFPQYDTEAKRPHDREPLGEGLLLDDYFRRSNTSPADHYFKGHLAVPWLSEVFGLESAP